jgi:hypothetical protein
MESVDVPAFAFDDTSSTTRPVIVDLGKKSRKAIKRLKKGTGDTMLEVEAAVRQVRARLSEADKLKPAIPIVIIYERKGKSLSLPSLPLSPLSFFR